MVDTALLKLYISDEFIFSLVIWSCILNIEHLYLEKKIVVHIQFKMKCNVAVLPISGLAVHFHRRSVGQCWYSLCIMVSKKKVTLNSTTKQKNAYQTTPVSCTVKQHSPSSLHFTTSLLNIFDELACIKTGKLVDFAPWFASFWMPHHQQHAEQRSILFFCLKLMYTQCT